MHGLGGTGGAVDDLHAGNGRAGPGVPAQNYEHPEETGVHAGGYDLGVLMWSLMGIATLRRLQR